MAGDVAAAGPTRRLVIMVPGINRQPERWDALRDALLARGTLGDPALVDWHPFNHRLWPFARRPMRNAAAELEAWIAGLFDAARHREVILIGHSAGGALVRQAWLDAIHTLPGQFAKIPWGRRVSRIVLFAGLSRGIAAQRGPWRKLGTRLVQALPGRFTAEDCVRGSSFLTNLRIDWIRTMARLPMASRPIVALVLGTEDTLVEEDDSSDVLTFRNALYRRIPGAGHGDLHHLDRDAALRLNLIEDAFTETPPADAPPEPAAVEGERVLMLVHGIRDSSNAGWVTRARARVQQGWPGVIAVAPDYGYVSAWRFALPGSRKRHSRAFRDFYTEELAKRPRATFGAVCHSNGSYLLGRSLRDFTAIEVSRVALAGSVLPQSYPWGELVGSGRVAAVRSDAGAGDWPVGLLCSALSGIGMRDVGTGGCAGFLGTTVESVRFHRGGHSGMLSDGNLDSMLDFVLETRTAPPPVLEAADAGWFGFLSRAAPLLAPVVAVGLGALLVYGVVVAVIAGAWATVALLLAIPVVLYFLLETF